MSEASVFFIGVFATAITGIIGYAAWKISRIHASKIPIRNADELKVALDYKLELDRRDREAMACSRGWTYTTDVKEKEAD